MMLDVGCGASAIGDVNCDLMVQDADLKWDRIPSRIQNFVRADVKYLPFRSRIFDVVFCSHVLEHEENPDLGLQELKRVSCKTVIVLLPFALFSVFDIFWCGRSFGSHIRWLRKHHRHFFLMDPLKTGCFQLRFPSLAAALRKEKKFEGWLRIPIPFETKTVIRVDHDV